MDRATVLRLMSAAFSFFVAGVSDGSIGALIPYMLREYNISEAIVSSIYGANFFGWFFAAIANTHLSQYLDLGAMLALGAFFQVVAQTLRAWNPPFGLFVATFWIVSVGQAFQDAHANTYVAGVKGAHRWLALIHAMYMAGCLVGPFVATPIASAGEVSQWYLFYIFPLGIGIVNLAWCLVAFRDTVRFHDNKSNANVEDAAHAPAGDDAAASRNKNALTLMKKTIKTPSVWLLSMFYFFYIGAALTASGWVTQYLVEVRGGNLSQMGYVPAGFSGGCFLGRLLLAEPTYRFGERRMVFIYILLAVALQLVFWLVPNIIAASVAISFIGFFTGPLFATGMSVGSKLFSQEIHSTALALIFVVAQMGGSALPIITGVIASRSGVAILQPILVGVLAATGVSWLLVPHPKTSNAAFHQE
ncbi:major facilitator superfamily domain-containing protein [Stachybotrys elegans]|uniref:Major facilitator superfamily domain-containing protein n=1 Tax=Stachybotrys elegans TaxID=80388 RepID=A0A8K0WLP2_9HYPO|nr:major facilitator superfamily domain-containing protein [Stachybotrys elegans]